MVAEQWDLKPDNCPVLWCSNPRENHASFIRKKHLRSLINLELFLTLFILVYYEEK